MAVADWVEIYQDETTDELKRLRKSFLERLEQSFAAQAQGSKSYEENRDELKEKTQAITRILRQRGQNVDDSDYEGTADFSRLGGIS